MTLVPRVHHLWDSPTSTLIYSGEGEHSGEYEFAIVDCATSPEAYDAIINGDGANWPGIDGEIDGLLCRQIRVSPDGPNAWKAVAVYGEPKLLTREREKLKEVGDYRVAFSMRPITTKHFVAKATTRFPNTAKDYGHAINVRSDGEVEGVDVITPALTITYTERMSGGSLTPAYALAVSTLVGKYNNATFMGQFPPGTIQFSGGDAALSFLINNPLEVGPQVQPQDRELSFEFLFSPNLDNATIGGITGVNKKGHQYMWIDWKSELDGSNRVVRKPLAVYVQDLIGIEPASFAPLALNGI